MKLVLGGDFPQAAPRGMLSLRQHCPDTFCCFAGYFLTKIFHPNIAPNGDICVNTLKATLRPLTPLHAHLAPLYVPSKSLDMPFVAAGLEARYHPQEDSDGATLSLTTRKGLTGSHLQVIRCLLIEPGPDSALNEEAAVLMQEDFEAYSKRARYAYTVLHV